MVRHQRSDGCLSLSQTALALGMTKDEVWNAEKRMVKRIRQRLLDLLDTDTEFEAVWGRAIRQMAADQKKEPRVSRRDSA